MKNIVRILIGIQIIALYISLFASLFTLVGLRNKNTIIYCLRGKDITCSELQITSVREIRSEGIYQLNEIDLSRIHKHYVVTYIY